jgi:hypothetical protein
MSAQISGAHRWGRTPPDFRSFLSLIFQVFDFQYFVLIFFKFWVPQCGSQEESLDLAEQLHGWGIEVT